MLPEEIERSISSICESELEDLYQLFCEKNGTNNDDKFVSELYKSDHINKEELKNYQILKKIELTAVVDISSIKMDTPHAQGDDGNSQDNFTILESIDKGGMTEILIARDNELG
jgi:hypothetical protein